MSLNKTYLITAFFVICNVQLFASHIIGGEMTMQHVIASRYEVSLKLFYDAADGQDVVEDSIIISSFRKTDNQKIEDYYMTRSLNYENAELTNTLCSDGLNIRIYTYTSTVFIDENLYSSSGGYYFSWQRCCRANNISNISNSGTAGFVFYFEFPSPNNFIGNSSPQFSSVSGDYYCVGEEVQIDFGAIDPDNDDLIYSLITPMAGFSRPDDNVIIGQSGPYPLVNGYFDVSPVNGVLLSSTGILSFTPAQSGLYTAAVLCEEFRNGEKIGEVIRDLAILIRNCEDNQSPEIIFYPYGESQPYVPGDTVLIRSQNDLCHLIETKDPDSNSQNGEVNYVTFDLLGYNVLAPEISINQNAPIPQWELCFPNCESPEQNFFTIRLSVADDHCPVPAENLIEVNFKIIESEDVPPIISTNYIPEMHKIGETINFQVRVSDVDSSGIDILFKGEGFNPEMLGMEFNYNLENCCEANGDFTWEPQCSNILEIDKYKLYFTASGENCGISGKDSLSLDLFIENPQGEFTEELSFPNVITPNGDGINDSFYFPILDENLCLERSFRWISIYNRWGREVFHSNKSDFNWKAQNVAAGQYFYQVSFEEKTFKGFLHILN